MNELPFLPWNHPLRIEAEVMVQRYNDYAQTHLASDNKVQLAEMFITFLHYSENLIDQRQLT